MRLRALNGIDAVTRTVTRVALGKARPPGGSRMSSLRKTSVYSHQKRRSSLVAAIAYRIIALSPRLHICRCALTCCFSQTRHRYLLLSIRARKLRADISKPRQRLFTLHNPLHPSSSISLVPLRLVPRTIVPRELVLPIGIRNIRCRNN